MVARRSKVPDSDHLYEYGIDLPRHRVYLNGAIGRMKIMRAIQSMSLLARQSETAPIQLVINSGGGDMVQGFALIDYMNSLPNRIDGIVLGECCSAALVILQVCNTRIAGHNAAFMTHRGNRSSEFDAMIDVRADKIIADRMQWTTQKLDKYHSYDRYFTAQQALEMGLLDSIMEAVTK